MAYSRNDNDDEDAIWNYKFGGTSKSTTKSKQQRSGTTTKCSTNGTAANQKDDSKGAPNNAVINIDSDEEFPLSNFKLVNNEKSVTQWASLFSNKQERKTSGVNVYDDKNSPRRNKRKSVPSRSPLKTKTNHPRGSRKEEPKGQIGSPGIKNYLSPTKNFSKKMKLSSSDELSSSLEEASTECVVPSVSYDKMEIPSTSTDEGSDSSTQALSLSGKLIADCERLVSGVPKYSDKMHTERISEDIKPKVVDVIVLNDDDGDTSVRAIANEANCIDTFHLSDTDNESAQQTESSDIGSSGGGFILDDDRTDSPSTMSKTEPVSIDIDRFTASSDSDNDADFQIETAGGDDDGGGFILDDDTSPSQISKTESSSASSSSLPSTSSSNNDSVVNYRFQLKKSFDNVKEAPTLPLSTAARKQQSIMSFFSAKAFVSTSKSKDTSDQNANNGNGISVLSKSRTFPPAKTPSQNNKIGGSSSYSSTIGDGNNQSKGRQQRQCPFYKKIPDTSFTVDAFRYGNIPDCTAYFLTHFHYDHYGGLTKKFTQPIYCSKITGNLVERRLGVDKRWIRRVPMWKPVAVDGVTLTLMEANHCPGAVIVLFETKTGKKILHTGDFRASLEMEDYSTLKGLVVDELYLDTTYCDPAYAFPSQKTVIDFAVSLVEKQIAINPNTLVVCGAYTIGKERIFTAIARCLDSKICVMSDKKKVLDCLEDEDLKKRVTLNWSEGQVHVLPMGKLKQESLFDHHSRHRRYTSILAFEPTGWTHSNKAISLDSLGPKWSKNGVTLYGIPYSEHSSYLELKRFVQFIRPKKILPTVNNGNPASRKKMENIFKEWLSE